jgi:hypothetical protein
VTDPIAAALNAETPEVIELRRENARLQRQVMQAAAARSELKERDAQIIRLERELGIVERLSHRTVPPAWLKAPKKAKQHRGTPWLLLSDLHLDEVVDPGEMMGVNAYNRTIAELRLRKTFESTVKITRDYWAGVTYDGIVCALGGDLFSGSIHEELKETNEDTMLGSLDHWIEHLAAGVAMLADEFGKVHVPVVVGNHGRSTRKPRAKLRARDNFDWFLGRSLQRAFATDSRVTFDVSESPDCLVPSYGQTVNLTHGDQATGGAGIGGIWPPLMRLTARKSQRYAAVQMPFDLMVCGHWHQLVFGPQFIVNGSLKGYDEYAAVGNFTFEPPAQALWLMTPERGKTFTAPIHPQDRAAEGW